MTIISRSILAAIAVMLVLGVTACSTVKHEPAPAAPAPAFEPKPDRG